MVFIKHRKGYDVGLGFMHLPNLFLFFSCLSQTYFRTTEQVHRISLLLIYFLRNDAINAILSTCASYTSRFSSGLLGSRSWALRSLLVNTTNEIAMPFHRRACNVIP